MKIASTAAVAMNALVCLRKYRNGLAMKLSWKGYRLSAFGYQPRVAVAAFLAESRQPIADSLLLRGLTGGPSQK
jgi:hypothetical protein